MQHPCTPGPSQRWSPASLDPTMFGPGAEQSRVSQHDYAHTFTTTATMNAYYPYATQAGYANDTQTSKSSRYPHTTRPSSSHQYHDQLYALSVQPYQQTGASYQSASVGWPQLSYHGSSGHSSTNYGSSSADQHAAATVSTSTRQSAASGSHASPEKRTKALKLTASTSRRLKDSNPDMNSKMGRWRLGMTAPAQPPSQPFTVGELKRKDRAPSPTETTSAADAPINKKAKPAATGAGTSEGLQKSDRAEKAKKHRDKLSRDVADLATRLPHHLQLFEDKPTVANIRQAVIHIDELENEAAQLRGAHVAYEQEIFRLRSVQFENEQQIQVLKTERVFHLESLHEKESRIRALEVELQTWRYP